MNSTIPLLGGVPFCGGEGVFQFFLIILRKIEKKRSKDEILTSSNQKTTRFLTMTDLKWA
jgi:hypothetical protein